MLQKIFFTCLCSLFALPGTGQLSNMQLLEIKDQTDAGRITWNDAFEEGITLKNFSSLPDIRHHSSAQIEQGLQTLRGVYASGDGRELLTTVINYLKIQQQFVRDVMIPAEKLNPQDEEGIQEIRRKINSFSGKEKSFLIDINNALRAAAANPVQEAAEDLEEDEFNAEEQLIEKEKKKPRRKGKLPHEQTGRKKGQSRDEQDMDEW